jgi:hypothetical protein
MLADELDYVVGVDTHRDQHTLAVVVAGTGAVVAQTVVETSTRGYTDARRFWERHAAGARLWAIEGAAQYGAGRSRFLAERDETVLEVGRQLRGERRLRGKDDGLDAIRAARGVLASETLTLPRAGEASGGVAGAAVGPSQRRRRPPGRACPAAQRDRDRT